jgi:hypothetical protein
MDGKSIKWHSYFDRKWLGSPSNFRLVVARG